METEQGQLSMNSVDLVLSGDEQIQQEYRVIENAVKIVLTNRRVINLSPFGRDEAPIDDVDTLNLNCIEKREPFNFFWAILALLFLGIGIVVGIFIKKAWIYAIGIGIAAIVIIIGILTRKLHQSMFFEFCSLSSVTNLLTIGEPQILFMYSEKKKKVKILYKMNMMEVNITADGPVFAFDKANLTAIIGSIGAKIQEIKDKNMEVAYGNK